MVLLLADFPYSNTGCYGFLWGSTIVDGYIAEMRLQSSGNLLTLWQINTGYPALIILVEMGKLSSVIAIIIITREFVITGFRMLAASEGVIAASGWGKLKTILQIIAI